MLVRIEMNLQYYNQILCPLLLVLFSSAVAPLKKFSAVIKKCIRKPTLLNTEEGLKKCLKRENLYFLGFLVLTL